MSYIRAFGRFTIFLLGISFYIVRYLCGVPFYGHQLERGMRLRASFLSWLVPMLGVHIERKGKISSTPGIYVSNHRSYFDPVVILLDILALPVAKKEVRTWPLVGFGLEISGILFVDRDDAQSRKKAREKMGRLFQKGYSILLFPEGTTHTSPSTIDFRFGAFKEATSTKAPIYPIAIAYETMEDAWVGTDTFIRHFFARFGRRNKTIRLSYGPPLFTDDYIALKDQAQSWINCELEKMSNNSWP